LREDEVKDKWDFNLYVYVGDNPVMGYDNFRFWGISSGSWAYVPPKPKIPDWCKCKRKRDEFYWHCVNGCMLGYHGNDLGGRIYGGGNLIISGFYIWKGYSFANFVSWLISGFDYFLDWFTGRNLPEASDFAGWWYGCRIWCREILNDICEPDRWMSFGKGYHGFGYRKF